MFMAAPAGITTKQCAKKAPPFWIFNVSLLGLHTAPVEDALTHIDVPIAFEKRLALGLGQAQEVSQVGRVGLHQRRVVVDGSPDTTERPSYLATVPHLILIGVGFARIASINEPTLDPPVTGTAGIGRRPYLALDCCVTSTVLGADEIELALSELLQLVEAYEIKFSPLVPLLVGFALTVAELNDGARGEYPSVGITLPMSAHKREALVRTVDYFLKHGKGAAENEGAHRGIHAVAGGGHEERLSLSRTLGPTVKENVLTTGEGD